MCGRQIYKLFKLIHGQIFTEIINILDPKANISFQGFVTIKRLGITDGKDKLYYYGNIFTPLWEDAKLEMKNK
ncbi:MAG: hypothetical protein JWP81_2478 [Ferruginibacter sp.]|nr:hypothetical protein [Ferruginibacter sp.]